MNKILPVIMLTTLIGGCINQGTQISEKPANVAQSASWEVHRLNLNKVHTWEAKGKIAASQDGEGGNASFVWENEGDFYKVRLFGPFGAGSAELTGSKKQVIFEQGDGTMNIANSPEELLFAQTGLWIPVRGLMYWIKGIPAPYNMPTQMQINENGELFYLIQEGWKVSYEQYKLHKGISMPSKMTLNRDGMKVKIIIKTWEIV